MESLFHLALLGSLASQAAFVEPGASSTPIVIAQVFHGYPCTHDCSGHQAGYEWAQRKDIVDPGSCGGNSTSFIEGCRAAAEEANSDDHDGESDQHDESDDQ